MSGHVYRIDGWGAGELWLDGPLVLAHDLPSPVTDRGRGQAEGADSTPASPLGGTEAPVGTVSSQAQRVCDGLVADLCRRIAGHLAGEPTTYDDVLVDEAWCTPFQAALLAALRGVPWGDVVSYGELAALAGRPGAARAAGAFCSGNRFALFVPCHRVVSATSIGGYGDAGIETKRRLLRLEGVEL